MIARVALLLGLFAFLLARCATDLAVTSCMEIGERSGCSGCNVGSKGQCEWCHDELDETGLGTTVGYVTKAPMCLPYGSCATAAGGGRVSARATLCPADPSLETNQRGELLRIPQSVVFSQGHYPRYCAFGVDVETNVNIARNNESFTYYVDRSIDRDVDACSLINNAPKFGVGVSMSLVARRCFGNHPRPLTPRMKACMDAFQAFKCTSSCPAYGVAIHGFCQKSCDSLLRICQPFIGGSGCPLNNLPILLNNLCVPDEERCDKAGRIPASETWRKDYGIYDYNLPVDCTWSPWSPASLCLKAPFSTCTEPAQGILARTRFVSSPALYDGECNGDTFKPEASGACPYDQRTDCFDCVWTWSAWSTCSPTTGTKTRSQQILKQPETGFPPCPTLSPETVTCGGFSSRVFQYDGDGVTYIDSPNILTSVHTNGYDSYTVGLYMDQSGKNSYQFEKDVLNFRATTYNGGGFDYDPATRYYYNNDRYVAQPTYIASAKLKVTTTGPYTFFSRGWYSFRFILRDDTNAVICTFTRSNGGGGTFNCALTLTAGRIYTVTHVSTSFQNNDYGVVMVAAGTYTGFFDFVPDLAARGFVLLNGVASKALGVYTYPDVALLPTIDYMHVIPTLTGTRGSGASMAVRRLNRNIVGLETAERLMASTLADPTCGNVQPISRLDFGSGGNFGLDVSYTIPTCAGAFGTAAQVTGVVNIPVTGEYSFCVNAGGSTVYFLELNPDIWTSTAIPTGLWRHDWETPLTSLQCKVLQLRGGEQKFRLIFANFGSRLEVSAAPGTATTLTGNHRIIGDFDGGGFPISTNF